jgi:hypothetical protein
MKLDKIEFYTRRNPASARIEIDRWYYQGSAVKGENKRNTVYCELSDFDPVT